MAWQSSKLTEKSQKYLRDPLERYCVYCTYYNERGCAWMHEVSVGQLLRHCKVDMEKEARRFVVKQLWGQTNHPDVDSLTWEVINGFKYLSSHTFNDPKGAGRLVIALLRILAWRRVYDWFAQERGGRPRASNCVWFQSKPHHGSSCKKSGDSIDPILCPKKECFEPFQIVRGEFSPEASIQDDTDPSFDHNLEIEQCDTALLRFFNLCPVLYDLLCVLLEAESQQLGEIKKNLAKQYKVSIRTIENWRHRAGAQFMVLYTGVLDQLHDRQPFQHSAVMARDFNPRFPLPSSPQPYSEIGEPLGLSSSQVRLYYRKGWFEMRDWMVEQSYPEMELRWLV